MDNLNDIDTAQFESGNSLIFTEKSQSIAKKQAEIAKLRQLENRAQTAIKVVIGGAMLAHATKDKNFAKTLVDVLEKAVTRDNDLKRLAGTLENLRKQAGLTPKLQVAKVD